MNEAIKKLLWGLYAQVYDAVMLRLLPYSQLIKNVTETLDPGEGRHYLDAGCGTGNFLLNLVRASPGLKITGIDFSPPMLKRAMHKCKKIAPDSRNVFLKEVDLDAAMPFDNEEFTGVICVNVLYAVSNPLFLLEEINRVLEKGGKLILITPPSRPQMGPVFKEHVRQLQKTAPLGWAFLLGCQIVYLIPSLVVFLLINSFIKEQQSFHFFTDEEISSLIKSCGFELISIKSVYGGQDWFLEVEKPVSEGI